MQVHSRKFGGRLRNARAPRRLDTKEPSIVHTSSQRRNGGANKSTSQTAAGRRNGYKGKEGTGRSAAKRYSGGGWQEQFNLDGKVAQGQRHDRAPNVKAAIGPAKRPDNTDPNPNVLTPDPRNDVPCRRKGPQHISKRSWSFAAE